MKTKISITVEKEKLKIIEMLLNNGKFRNRSYVVEYSLDKLLEEEDEK